MCTDVQNTNLVYIALLLCTLTKDQLCSAPNSILYILSRRQVFQYFNQVYLKIAESDYRERNSNWTSKKLIKLRLSTKKLSIVLSNRSFCLPIILKRKALSVFNLAEKNQTLARNEYHINNDLNFLLKTWGFFSHNESQGKISNGNI